MEPLIAFFDVNSTLFTLLGYPISYLEFVGTILNLVCVILVARRNIWNWPIGIAGVILFGILFYQINLYADVFEQIYYFITGIMGWYMWSRAKADDNKARIETNTFRANVIWVAGIALTSVFATWILSNVHVWWPAAFPGPASLPAVDATTTIASFAAQYLMMKRKLESWYMWIAIDIVAVWLYWYKDVPFVAILYLIFLINAVYGFVTWRRALVTEQPITATGDV